MREMGPADSQPQAQAQQTFQGMNATSTQDGVGWTQGPTMIASNAFDGPASCAGRSFVHYPMGPDPQHLQPPPTQSYGTAPGYIQGGGMPLGTAPQFTNMAHLQTAPPEFMQANGMPPGFMQGNGMPPGQPPQVMHGGGNFQGQGHQMMNGGGPQTTDGSECHVNFEPPRVGLRNLHNTCYMNTTIQSLFMTNAFVQRIYSFEPTLKQNPSKVDVEDFQFGQKLVVLLRQHLARMHLTRQPHLDIHDILQQFPESYRDGKEQDVTEAMRDVFDKLGSYRDSLIREVFSGELNWKTQCQQCGSVKETPETFSEMILPVPSEEEAMMSGVLPTTQGLLNQVLQIEYLSDDACLFCEQCQQKTRTGKWSEILSPPAHFCLHLGREKYDPKLGVIKVKTPVRVEATLQIGPFTYELYMVIVHTGKDANSGHYYAIGSRSEIPLEQKQWVLMDDSQLKPADLSILSGCAPDKGDDNPQVLFYRCQMAPPSAPGVSFPRAVVDEVMREDSVQMS